MVSTVMIERIPTKHEWAQDVADSVEAAGVQLLKAIEPGENGFSRFAMDDARAVACILREYFLGTASPVSKNQRLIKKPETNPV